MLILIEFHPSESVVHLSKFQLVADRKKKQHHIYELQITDEAFY